MLHLFRRQDKWKKWILSAVILTLAAGMLLLFVQTPSGAAGVGLGEIANCAGQPISAVEFRRGYRQLLGVYRQQFGDENFERFLPSLRVGDQALNRLITDCAVAYEAARLGLKATTEEIQDRVLAEPVFKDPNGRFVGTPAYEQILQSNNWSAAAFEESLRKTILREKLEQILTSGIEPSSNQLRQVFARQSQEFRVRYAYFDSTAIAEAEIDEDDLKTYYEGASATFEIPERRQAEYMMLPLDREAVVLTEEQIAERMELIPEVERVRASHILFKIPPGGDDAEARVKAEAAVSRIRAGEDFATLARELSEDTSAAGGGDLGFFTRGEMVPEFADVAFGQEAGEISEPVSSPFGVHIIQTTSKPRTRDESRRFLAESQLRDEEANRIHQERSTQLVEELKNGANINDVGQREGLRTGMTESVSADGNLTRLGLNVDFVQQMFATPEGEFLAPYSAQSHLVIARIASVEAAKIPAFDDVREDVGNRYKEIKAGQLAKTKAQDLFQAALGKGSLEQAAGELELQLIATSFFKVGSTVDDILQFSPVLHDRVVTMEVGEISPPITVAGKEIVFEMLEKSPIDEVAFGEQKEGIAASQRQQQRSEVFLGYVQNVVDKLREDQRIAIDSELLNSITGSL